MSALWLAPAPLLLASQSKVRRAVLEAAGVPVEARPAALDERAVEACAPSSDPSAVAAMLEAYDFSGVITLADIGGGNGSLLSAVLGQYPQMRGILFDLPGVAGRTRANIEAAGLTE